MPRLDLMPDPVMLPKWTANIILRLVTKDFYSLSEEERELLIALILLIRSKFDPDDYEIIFRLLSNNSIILTLPTNLTSRLLTPRESGTPTPTSLVSGDLSTLTLPKKPRKSNSQKSGKPNSQKTLKTTSLSASPALDTQPTPLPELTAEEYLPFTFD